MKSLAPLLITVMCAAVSTAVASDDTVYAGSMCKYYGNQAGDTDLTPQNGNATGMKNTSASTRAVTCPILRNDVSASEIYMAVVNVSGTSWTTTDCSIRCTEWDGSGMSTSGTATLTSNTNNNTSQFYWSDFFGVTTCGDYANYAVYCGSVRPGQWIRKYEAQEAPWPP